MPTRAPAATVRVHRTGALGDRSVVRVQGWLGFESISSLVRKACERVQGVTASLD